MIDYAPANVVLSAADGLLSRSPGDLPIVNDARWSAALTQHSIVAVAFWVAMLIVLQVASRPLQRLVFRRFRDTGWGFGRLTTLIMAAWPIWFLSSTELLAFRAIWCIAAIVCVAVVSWLLPRRLARPRTNETPWFRNPMIYGAEIVFWLFFAWFLTYRFMNPDSWHIAWGGEKPMELAHINAILRTAHFPPPDPWYSGGTLNYYYYGMYLVSFLVKLTGIPSEIAFNLAQPTVIALLASGSWSVGVALASAISKRRWIVLIGGALAVILVNVAGNLVVAARLVTGIGSSLPSLDNYVYWFWDPRQIVPRTINEFPYFTATYADLHAHVVALPITVLAIALNLAMALESRAMVTTVARPRRDWRRTLSIAIRLLILVVVLGSLYMTNAWDVPTYLAVTAASLVLVFRAIQPWWRRLVVSAAMACAIAVVAWATALPFIRHFLSRYGELGFVTDSSPLYAIEGHFGVFLLIALCGISVVAATHGRSWVAWQHPLVAIYTLVTVLVLRWAASTNGAFFLDGLTVLIVVGWLLMAVGRSLPETLDFGLSARSVRFVALTGFLTVIAILVLDRPSLALLAGIGISAVLAWFIPDRPGIRYSLMLVAAGALVSAGVEVVYLVDDLGGGEWYRMNTVFKFYNAAWILFALGSAALLALMIREAIPHDGVAGDPLATAPQRSKVLPSVAAHLDAPLEIIPPPPNFHEAARAWSRVGLVVASVAILASFAYPIVATGVRLNQHFQQPGRHRTLNALDWMSYGEIHAGSATLTFSGDRAAIEWFNTSVPGTPIITEAVLGAYMCAGSRISIHTGLPTVVGWTWHETQQRGATDLYERERAIRDLYTSGDRTVINDVLNRYGVAYVVVGDLERWYPEPNCAITDNSAGIAALASLVGTRFEVAFSSGSTIVYRVRADS